MLRAHPFTAVATACALVLTALVAVVALAGPAAAAGTVTVTIQGKGTVTADGISCTETAGSDCSEFYADENTCDFGPPPCFDIPPSVVLVAEPDRDGYTFVGFTGCTNASGRSCSVLVNTAKSVTATFADLTEPSVTLTSPAGGSKLRGTIPLTANASDAVGVKRVEFRVRSLLVGVDTAAPYQASFNSTPGDDGSAHVSAIAFDTSENASPASAVTITIDNTAPSLNVTGPSGSTHGPGSSQTWTITASDATTPPLLVQCSVVTTGPPASFGACSGGNTTHSVTNRPEGGHTFTVRATDGAGNVTEVARSFTIDATPPDTALTGGPAQGSLVAGRTVTFGFSANEAGSTFQCRLHPAGTTPPAFGPCSGTGSHTANGLNDGGYRFEVMGVDAVGNTDQTPVSRDFSVDATAPQATLTKQPKKKVKTTKKKAKVAFGFAADDPAATFRCSLDGAAFTACNASVTFKVKVGKHILRVIAVDAVGNLQATPTAWAFKVKRVAKRG